MSYHRTRVARIDLIGHIWQPGCGVCAQTLHLSSRDEESLLEQCDGVLSRDGVQLWLDSHAGDFEYILDFCADIGSLGVIEWAAPESEWAYNDAMYPSED